MKWLESKVRSRLKSHQDINNKRKRFQYEKVVKENEVFFIESGDDRIEIRVMR